MQKQKEAYSLLEYFNEVIFVNSINVTRPYAKWNKDA